MTVLTARFPDPSDPPRTSGSSSWTWTAPCSTPTTGCPAGSARSLADLADRGIAFCPGQRAAARDARAPVRRRRPDATTSSSSRRTARTSRRAGGSSARSRSTGTWWTTSCGPSGGWRRAACRPGPSCAASGRPGSSATTPSSSPRRTQYYALLEQVDDLLAVDDEVLKMAVFDAGSAADTTAPRSSGSPRPTRSWSPAGTGSTSWTRRCTRAWRCAPLQERLGITAGADDGVRRLPQRPRAAGRRRVVLRDDQRPSRGAARGRATCAVERRRRRRPDHRAPSCSWPRDAVRDGPDRRRRRLRRRPEPRASAVLQMSRPIG